mmetsp:Transcript_26625/g.76201  ORF Transcript_26625/g.76201 Transcript_26625/m.76201 type:complete len:277 (+) Transcript_26625:506-1336(+)
MQTCWPSCDWKRPGAQGAGCEVPAGHPFPTRQVWHSLLPVLLAKVPDGQLVQVLSPKCPKLPRAQGVQRSTCCPSTSKNSGANPCLHVLPSCERIATSTSAGGTCPRDTRERGNCNVISAMLAFDWWSVLSSTRTASTLATPSSKRYKVTPSRMKGPFVIWTLVTSVASYTIWPKLSSKKTFKFSIFPGKPLTETVEASPSATTEHWLSSMFFDAHLTKSRSREDACSSPERAELLLTEVAKSSQCHGAVAKLDRETERPPSVPPAAEGIEQVGFE